MLFMDLTLNWRGPIGAGNFPIKTDLIEELNESGIYLRIKTYKNERNVVYIGQSRKLLSRFEQHIRNVLSFKQMLRDTMGHVGAQKEWQHPFLFLNNLPKLAPFALAEAKRVKFYFALSRDGFDEEYLFLIESVLKSRAEEIRQEDVENIQNITSGEFDHDIQIFNDYSRVNKEGQKLIINTIGKKQIVITAQQDYE